LPENYEEKKMDKDTLTYQQSEAYTTGYYTGYSQVKARPEDFPGRRSEYIKGYSKGWSDKQKQNYFIFT
jgi:hypothetical protein